MLRRPARGLKASVLVLLLLVALLAGGAAAFPAYAGVLQPPFAVFVAMRRLALLAALLLATCALLATLATPSPRRLRITAGAATLLLAVSMGLTIAAGSTTTAPRTSTRGGAAITVLSWNTGQDRVPQATIDRLVATVQPDVVVLPEYFGAITGGLAIAHSKKYRMYSWDSSASSLFISTRLGPYRLDTRDVPPWAGFTLRPARPGSPQITVAHLQRPTLLDGTTWRQHLAWTTASCSSPNTIAVGDFNAAPENLPTHHLGACTDAAATLHASNTGTWPTLLPPGLGTQIDHAYLGSNWTPTRFTVIGSEDHAGSDHRPITLTIQHR